MFQTTMIQIPRFGIAPVLSYLAAVCFGFRASDFGFCFGVCFGPRGRFRYSDFELARLVMHVVLFEPEIPPNTGSVARLCAATLTPLHLIEPLGFKIDDKHLKRAGLDYWEFVDFHVHKSWDDFMKRVKPSKLLYFSKKAERSYTSVDYENDDYLVFGPETRGLPAELLDGNAAQSFRIPMMGHGVRSLNLSNAVSIVLYEGLRQLGKA